MTIQNNISDVTARIEHAAAECQPHQDRHYATHDSKTKPCEAISEAIEAGLQRQFGENYVQEGVEKIQYFSHRNDLIWHFIGPLQSNKNALSLNILTGFIPRQSENC